MNVAPRVLGCAGEYDLLLKIGVGTYGEVFKARSRRTGEHFALKRLKTKGEKQGFPITALREIRLLRSLRNAPDKPGARNVVQLIETFVADDTAEPAGFAGNTFMVFEYMDFDLVGYMERAKGRVQLSHIKCIIYQVLQSMHFLHTQQIIHRDIKPANILMNKEGLIQTADFGLGKKMKVNAEGKKVSMTPTVITRWYRAPEVLLDYRDYDYVVDIWSVGCLLVELLTQGRVLFPGKDDLDQLHLIFKICGTPIPETWPGVEKLTKWVKPREIFKPKLREYLIHNGVKCRRMLDFVCLLLSLDPSRRPSACRAMEHPVFEEEPKMCNRRDIPLVESAFEYNVRGKYERMRRERQAEDNRMKTEGSQGREHNRAPPHHAVIHDHRAHHAGKIDKMQRHPMDNHPSHPHRVPHVDSVDRMRRHPQGGHPVRGNVPSAESSNPYAAAAAKREARRKRKREEELTKEDADKKRKMD